MVGLDQKQYLQTEKNKDLIMQANFNLCDICGERVEQTLSFFVTADRQVDAAGDSDNVGRNVDLCNICAVEYIKHLLKDDLEMM